VPAVAGRLSRGWRFAKASLAVVRRDGALAGLAVLGIIVACVLAAVPLIASALAFDGGQNGIGYVLLGVTAFLVYFAVVFFGVATVLAAADVLDGKDATVGSATSGAMRRLGPIVGWSIVGAAMNLLFAVLRSRGGLAGNILAGVGAAAWSLVTFLAVPVIAFEGLGPIATLKRSAGLFRERWGEQLVGNVSINGIFFLLSLPGIALVVLGFVVGSGDGSVALGAALVVGGVIAVAVVAVLGRAASATFGAILYRYAATGEAVGPLAPVELEAVARSGARSGL
jgi:Family of unknown function (DUF6159)